MRFKANLGLFFENIGCHRWIIKAFGIFIALLAFYIIDVWLLGSMAAFLAQKAQWIAGGFKEAPEHNALWYFKHPFFVAWSWLGSSKNLSYPQVRMWWMGLNVLLIVAALTAFTKNKLCDWFGNVANKQTLDRDIKKLKYKQIEYSAIRCLEKTSSEKIFLGLDDHRRSVTLPAGRLTEHMHILGGSGTGKTSFAVLPICVQAIRRHMPTIIIDFKGDEQGIKLLAREAKSAGKKFFFFTLKPGLASNTYNPLGSGDAMSKVQRIMTALDLNFEGQAKFYSYCQQAIFYPLAKYLDDQGIKYCIRDIQSLLKNPELTKDLTGEEINPGQIKGLVAALTLYADVPVVNVQSADIDLATIMKSGDVCYFDLRSAVAPEVATALGKMIAMDLQARAVERSQKDNMVVIAIDEFQNMACSAFTNIISKVRSANYSMVLANQALGDLKDISEGFLNTITTNTGTKIIFGVEDAYDADYFARRSGKIVVTSTSLNTGTSRPTGSLVPRNKNKGETVSELDKPLVHSNILLRMPPGKSLIFRRGELAVLANHSHLLSLKEKAELEAGPWPTPEKVRCSSAIKTVNELVEKEKQNLTKRKIIKQRSTPTTQTAEEIEIVL